MKQQMKAFATVGCTPIFVLALIAEPSCSKDRTSQGVPAQVASSNERPAVVRGRVPATDVAKLMPPLEPDPLGTKAKRMHVAFNWSPPCRVPIVQDVVKGGHATRLRMNAVLETRGEDLALGMRDVRIATMDGADMSGLPMVVATSASAGLAMLIPDVIISRNGTFRGVDDLNGFVERAAKVLESWNVAELSKTASLLRLPAMQKALIKDVHEVWISWVETWIDLSIPAGTEERIMMKEEVAGNVMTWPLVVANRGPVVGAPDLVLLSMHETFEGPGAERMFEGAGAVLLNELSAPPIPADAYTGIHVNRTIVTAIDPRNARPRRVRSEVRTIVGGIEQVESRDTMFEWAEAVGCVR